MSLLMATIIGHLILTLVIIILFIIEDELQTIKLETSGIQLTLSESIEKLSIVWVILLIGITIAIFIEDTQARTLALLVLLWIICLIAGGQLIRAITRYITKLLTNNKNNQ